MAPQADDIPGAPPGLALLEALGHAVIATDMAGVITYWNEAATRLYGFEADEVLGQQIYYVLPAALGDDEIDGMMRSFEAGKPWDGLLRMRHKSGEWIRTIHSDRVVLGADGKPAAIVSASLAATVAEGAAASEKADAVTKDAVRALLRSLRGPGPENASRMRETGRAMARRANCPGTTVYLELFAKMGLGDLKLDDETPARLVFSGRDLLERVAQSRHPTCDLPLGFLEGAVAALTGRAALGAEVRCQSMGAPRCVFVVSTRAPEPAR